MGGLLESVLLSRWPFGATASCDMVAVVGILNGICTELGRYLTKKSVINSLVDEGSPYMIAKLENIGVEGVMTVDRAAHSALGIFDLERHPSFQEIGTKKEGHSVFGMLGACCASVRISFCRFCCLVAVSVTQCPCS
eukprot:SAG31_NODE_1558_length_7885_cov_2.567300_4_plen_137_part_00